VKKYVNTLKKDGINLVNKVANIRIIPLKILQHGSIVAWFFDARSELSEKLG
jgi:hypothetical protein